MKLEKRNEIEKALYNSAPILLSTGVLMLAEGPSGNPRLDKNRAPEGAFRQCWLRRRRRDLGIWDSICLLENHPCNVL